MEFEYRGQSKSGGVYKITNLVNNKVYIGSAKCFQKRAYQHRSSLEKGVHQNKHLQAAFNQDGTENFLFEVLEVVDGDKTERTTKEQEYIDQYLDNWEQCYNFKKKTVDSDRTVWSNDPEETKRKLSEKMSGEGNPMYGKLSPFCGRTHSEDTKQQMREAAKERWEDREYQVRISQANKELWEDEEYRKQRIAGMPEARKKQWANPAFRKSRSTKVSADMKKRWEDPEFRAKMSARSKKRWEDFRQSKLDK